MKPNNQGEINMFVIALFTFLFCFCCCMVAELTSTSITHTSVDTFSSSSNDPNGSENQTNSRERTIKPLELSNSKPVTYQQICKLKLPQLRVIARLLEINEPLD